MMRSWISCSVLVCALGVSPVVFSQTQIVGGQWPHWRGPNRDAISAETGLLLGL